MISGPKSQDHCAGEEKVVGQNVQKAREELLARAEVDSTLVSVGPASESTHCSNENQSQ